MGQSSEEKLREKSENWSEEDLKFFNKIVKSGQIRSLASLLEAKNYVNHYSTTDPVKYYRADNLKDVYNFFLDAKFTDFLYRGEAGIYDNLEASIHRLKDVNVMSVLQEYYSEIGADLLPVEERNFLLYAQHHGLPTPLLDTSEILNTAIYFACNEDGNTKSNFGILHILKKDFSIDISNLISNGNSDINIFDEYLKIETDQKFNGLFSTMFRQFEEANKDIFFSPLINQINNELLTIIKELRIPDPSQVYPIDSPFTNLNDQYFACAKLIQEAALKGNLKIGQPINQFMSMNGKNKLPTYLLQQANMQQPLNLEGTNFLLKKYLGLNPNYIPYENMDISSINYSQSADIYTYFILLDICLYFYRNYFYYVPETNYLPHLPYFFTKSNVKFGRIKAQQGSFIYQAYGNTLFHDPNNPFGNSTKKYLQRIVSNERILITDKKKFLGELRYMGVDRGTIYLDPDNIARHIKDKYS